MSYYTRWDYYSTAIGGLFFLFSVAVVIYGVTGWFGLAIAVLALFAWYGITRTFRFWKDKAIERRRSRTPCRHGTVGAHADHTKCTTCLTEHRRVEEASALATRQRAEQAEAQRRQAYDEWRSHVRLPEFLRSMHPQRFERLICELFRRQDYQVEPTPYVGDGGVDAYLRRDGQLAILQCKRVQASIGEPMLRDVFGTMVAAGAGSAIVVTTGNVSNPARRWVEGKPIRIVELDELRNLLTQHFSEADIVPPEFVPAEGLVDACRRCGSPLRLVRGRRGPFWGCSRYPTCHYTRSSRS